MAGANRRFLPFWAIRGIAQDVHLSNQPSPRLRAQMTQQQLADAAGCTRQTIYALEQGGYVPSLALAFRIARAFGLGVEDVFEFEAEA